MTLPKKITACLAQTQCRLCQYDDCQAYANAIANQNEQIDRCQPGGVATLEAIALVTEDDSNIYREHVKKNTKKITLAVIREQECIGCTKCIQVCPVDAIIGSAKQMHTVITDACNGCELCLPACPVDCIDTIKHPKYQTPLEIKQQSQDRYEKRQLRRQQQQNSRRNKYRQAKKQFARDPIAKRKASIQDVLARAQAKKGNNDESKNTGENLCHPSNLKS